MPSVTIHVGDALDVLPTLPDASVQCCVTSPPYWGLRDYGVAGQLGLERTPEEYVAGMVAVFREVRRVLRDDGVLWLNLGDSYAASGPAGGAGKQHTNFGSLGVAQRAAPAGLKPKDLVGIPWRVAFALQADGWWLRSDIVWAKPNPMPESVRDRPTKAHEYLFMLTKRERYYYDADAIAEPLSPASLTRLEQPTFDQQTGGPKDYGNGTNLNRSARRAVENLHKRYRSGNKTRDIPDADDGRGIPNDHLGRSVPWEDTNGKRNARTVWSIPTVPFRGAHFATFPPELPKRCILAGTSERGRCPECGAPLERQTERVGSKPYTTGKSSEKQAVGLKTSFSGYEDGSSAPTYLTVGWKPGCEHTSDPTPSIVLDPFAGAGTTGLVAHRLGRSFIGIELNPDFAEMARRRIHDDAPLLMGGE